MSNKILSQNKQQARPDIVEIDITRHDYHYFYNRRINGKTVVTARRIESDLAQEIYLAYAERGEQYNTGVVDFDPAPRQWMWTVRVEVS